MLIAYKVAIEVIVELRPIVAAVKNHDAHLADQLHRAATNTVANLAEGQRREKGNKHRAFEIAHGEAREVLGCLDCANAWGWIADDAAARAKLDRLLGLLWGLTHSKLERPPRSARNVSAETHPLGAAPRVAPQNQTRRAEEE